MTESAIDGLIAASIYVAGDYAARDFHAALLRDILAQRSLPPIYRYMGLIGRNNWAAVVDSPRYTYYRDALALYYSHRTTLVDSIVQAAQTTPLDIISLGPGDGRKDQLILKALTKAFKPSKATYYPIEIGDAIIVDTLRTVGNDEDLTDMRIKAVLADFNLLPQLKGIYAGGSAPRLFLLLGNTIGNLVNERWLLERIYADAMSDGDILVLEVRNQRDVTDQVDPAFAHFEFGPLAYLGVPFDADKLGYITQKGLSTVSGTRTVVTRYSDFPVLENHGGSFCVTEVTLSIVHRYDPALLEEFCQQVGFTVQSKIENCSATALVLHK